MGGRWWPEEEADGEEKCGRALGKSVVGQPPIVSEDLGFLPVEIRLEKAS